MAHARVAGAKRPLALGLALLLPLFGGNSKPAAPAVTVVANTSIEAHKAAIEGIRRARAAGSTAIHLANLGEAGDRAQLTPPGTRLIIVLGSEALQVVAAGRPEVPVVSAMILRPPPAASSAGWTPAATISLDVPVPVLLARLKQVFPGKTRLTVIHNAASGAAAPPALPSRLQQEGFTVRIVDITGAEQLLSAFRALKGQTDFVWCLPDGALYNSATLKPLILASIENQLPLIGFSESFARAGAAMAVFPDFRDVGVQTGEVALQLLGGGAAHAVDGPRKLKIAVNQSVLRLIGLKYLSPSSGGEDFSVIP
jgi:putative ABC transport system substrate-binding protein